MATSPTYASPFADPGLTLTPQERAILLQRLQGGQPFSDPIVKPYDPNQLGGLQTPTHSQDVTPAGESLPPTQLATQVPPITPNMGAAPTPQPQSAAVAPPQQPAAVAPPVPPASPSGSPFAAAAPTATPVPPDASGTPTDPNAPGGAPNPMAQGQPSLPPEIAPGPARTPEEQEHRVSGWTQIVERLKSDPHLQLAMLKMGTAMMQPIQPGQTFAGHLGSAVSGSVDYLQAQKQAEANLAKTGAETTKTGAEAVTEAARPGAVQAGTGKTIAETAKTAEETLNLQQMSPLQMQEAEAKIKKLGSDAGLDDAKVKDLASGVLLKRDPNYIKAMISELEARAYYYKNPQLHYNTGAHFQEQLFNQLKESRKILDPGIAALVKQGTPESLAKADAMAISQANQLRYAGTTAHELATDDAEEQYSNIENDYDRLTKSKDPVVRGKSREDYISFRINDIMGDAKSRNMLNVIRARKRQEAAGGPPSGPPGGPSGTPAMGADPLGLRKGP